MNILAQRTLFYSGKYKYWQNDFRPVSGGHGHRLALAELEVEGGVLHGLGVHLDVKVEHVFFFVAHAPDK